MDDPRCDELERWLAGLPRRQELITRLTLSGMSEHCRGDPRWRQRVTELKRGLSAAGLASVLRDVQKRHAFLVGELDKPKRRK